MHRWAPFPLLCLMACVNEVGDWPEEEYSRSNPTEVQESAESRATESGLFPQERPLNADTEESSSGAADATEEDAAPADAPGRHGHAGYRLRRKRLDEYGDEPHRALDEG